MGLLLGRFGGASDGGLASCGPGGVLDRVAGDLESPKCYHHADDREQTETQHGQLQRRAPAVRRPWPHRAPPGPVTRSTAPEEVCETRIGSPGTSERTRPLTVTRT